MNGDIYEIYSAIRMNKIMWFEDEWMQMKNIILSELN
jgi:hypothetical protein